MGGRIEPAEPEPPPAHSLGRVDEDVMGRSGQLVRPRSLDAGGVAGGRNWWRGWWLRFFFIVFFYIFDRLGQENLPEPIRRFGSKDDTFFIDTPNGQFKTTASFLSWTPVPSTSKQVAWSSPRATPAAVRKQLLDTYHGEGISLQQLLLDLHSGRIMRIGPWISDLSALAILLLVISGLINWCRRPR